MFRSWLHGILASRAAGRPFDILVPPDPAMGDFSTNLAMVLAKHEKKNPLEVGGELCDILMAEGGAYLARCEVAGPGFVNLFLKDAFLREQLGKAAIPREGGGRKVIVEYSAPNIAKPMHVGHLRSTVIGDALARVYAAMGYEVIRWNYLGDWGTQFGKLIAAYKRWGDADEMERDPVGAMVRLYVRFHEEVKANPDIEAEGRTEFLKLESGDAENRALWDRFRRESLEEFEKTYARLGVSFDVLKGESEYETALKGVLTRLTDAGIASESEGALVVPLERFSLSPALVRKSDGATLYLTRDIASLEERIERYLPYAILYVVANQQALHFEQLFSAAAVMKEKALIEHELPMLIHVKYGLVLGSDGKKFSTREGNAVPLAEVLDEAVRRAEAVVRSKNPDLSDEKVREIAEAVGTGAVKYNDLRQHPHTDIAFDWDAMLALHGNSGPYLQYTYARLTGIRRKSENAQRKIENLELLTHPSERALMRHLLEFGTAVSGAAKMNALSGLALHCYGLAEKANRFYEQVRVSEDDDASRKAARLLLVEAVAGQLKAGMELLGITALERV